MPDRPATVAAYAAGASLAAITAFYVFGPTFFIDGENSSNTSDGRKRTIIGLSNPANDCFINSVLQALAGLGDLRLYLIRELHRRQLQGTEVYNTPPNVLQKGEKPDRIVNLQKGLVTRALKDMLDALNERPIYRKTISARPLIEALERAFQTRISRNQQDAQEFLQIVLERLCDEFHAAEKARKRAASIEQDQSTISQVNGGAVSTDLKTASDGSHQPKEASVGSNEGFPFEGRIESHIQCQHCGFKTKPSATTFVSLTLNVPQKNSTSLDNCFDILLKSEEIEDFKCDKCRLTHALEWKNMQLKAAKTEIQQEELQQEIALIKETISRDPEQAPENVVLPDLSQAPKRKIRKSTRITIFPKVIAIHLSRSVFDPQSTSIKNLAKVSYTQRLRLGGILNEHWYKLLGIVCHKGNHNSGHYESFRRNHLYPPFATPDAFSAYAAASKSTGTMFPEDTDLLTALPQTQDNSRHLESRSSASISTTSQSEGASRPLSQPVSSNGATVTSQDSQDYETRVTSPVQRTVTQNSKPQITSYESAVRFKRRKKSTDRWWRISDDKIKEARTSDVLSMQKEVYLLFYELERPGDDGSS